MTVIIEVRFAHEDGALAHTLRTLPGLTVEVIPETGTDPRGSVYFFRFDYEDAAPVRSTLADDHTVADVMPMPGYEDEHVLGIEFTPETELLAPAVTDHGGYALDARSATGTGTGTGGPRGWHERWLLPDREAVHAVWEHARETGFTFELLELRQGGGIDESRPGADTLTDQQRAALRAAYEQGYFREPREASLAELADSLDLSASATGGRIRRGTKSLIGQALLVEPAD